MEQYLIAHKVRGELAFDVAEKMEVGDEVWWIIPTSGHRAYPYWDVELSHVLEATQQVLPDMPDDLPEHYEVSAAPKGKGIAKIGKDMLVRLGLVKAEPVQSFKRKSW